MEGDPCLRPSWANRHEKANQWTYTVGAGCNAAGRAFRKPVCVLQKRLAKAKFFWPQNQEQAKEIDVRRLRMLLEGIDFWHTHETLAYSQV
jgi:transposase